MLDLSQKSTGITYTTTVALLVAGFIFSPALLVISRPIGYFSLSLAVACSALCFALAWFNWKKASQLTIPSIATQNK